MITSRRSLFGFGAALIAAPAIVRVAALMPISVPKYKIRRWIPYNVTSHSLSISQRPLTLDDIRAFKEVLIAMEVDYTAPISEEHMRLLRAA